MKYIGDKLGALWMNGIKTTRRQKGNIYNKVEFMTCDKLGTSARDRENQKIYFKKQKIKSWIR